MDEANSGLDVDYSTWETPNEPQPQLGGWQRIAEKMGYHYTDPYMMQRVDARRRQRRSEGLARQIRLDAPAEPTSKDVSDLMGKMDEVMDLIQARGNPRRQVSAPPKPPAPPKPLPSGPSGRGGIQLP